MATRASQETYCASGWEAEWGTCCCCGKLTGRDDGGCWGLRRAAAACACWASGASASMARGSGRACALRVLWPGRNHPGAPHYLQLHTHRMNVIQRIAAGYIIQQTHTKCLGKQRSLQKISSKMMAFLSKKQEQPNQITPTPRGTGLACHTWNRNVPDATACLLLCMSCWSAALPCTTESSVSLATSTAYSRMTS